MSHYVSLKNVLKLKSVIKLPNDVLCFEFSLSQTSLKREHGVTQEKNMDKDLFSWINKL